MAWQLTPSELEEIRKRSNRIGRTLKKRDAPTAPERAAGATIPSGPSPAERKAEQRSRRIKKRRTKLKKIAGEPYEGLDTEQSKILQTVLNRGTKRGATIPEKLSAVETGLVESNLRNLSGGDRDSSGWRQERASIYGTGPKGPQNVKASADRYFQEVRAQNQGEPPGELAAQTQRPAEQYRGRYAERSGEAKKLLRTYGRKRRAAKKLGRKVPTPTGPKPLKGPYSGSQTFVRRLVGSPVRGDKEPGHAAGGMHDPSNLAAYAQDINRPGGNPAEGEPAFDQATVTKIAENLRARGADIPKDFKLGQNWEGVVDGYEVELLTEPHGTGPHIHLGAEWTGAPEGTISEGGTAYGASVAPTGEIVDEGPGKARRKKGKSLARRLDQIEAIYTQTPEPKAELQKLKRGRKGVVV